MGDAFLNREEMSFAAVVPSEQLAYGEQGRDNDKGESSVSAG